MKCWKIGENLENANKGIFNKELKMDNIICMLNWIFGVGRRCI